MARTWSYPDVPVGRVPRIARLMALEIRSYVSEPDRGRRSWTGKSAERAAVYANRRRIRGRRGRRLVRQRGELLERPFAHCYDRGGMRRTHLRGHSNILKRVLIRVATSSLGLLMRQFIGVGTPRALADLASALWTASRAFLHAVALLRQNIAT